MILIDTTVLAYAVGSEHPLRAPCRRLIAAIGDGDAVAVTTVEVIQEFLRIRAQRRGRSDAIAAARLYVALLAPLIMPTEGELEQSFQLYASNETLGAFEAVLAAVVLTRPQLTAIASADRAFGGVAGLGHIDLNDPGSLRKIGIEE